MSEYSSYEITNFNLDGSIVFDQKFGLLKISRSDDGKLILTTDNAYGVNSQTEATQQKIVNNDSLLGFILDIGIRREKQLTYGSGYYFGHKLIQGQSQKLVSQKNLDSALMEKIGTLIQVYFSSGDPAKEVQALKWEYLLTAYNNARLLYPDFYNDSYLGLMRIIDATGNTRGACDFATHAALASHELNVEIYQKVSKIGAYTERLEKACQLFTDNLEEAKIKTWACKSIMETFEIADKFVFSCFFSAYQYRNKFVHQGMPFPYIVVQGVTNDQSSGMMYLDPSWGEAIMKIYRPGGLQESDSIDIHSIVQNSVQEKSFKERYFLLLPTLYFVKSIARAALIKNFGLS